MNVWRGARRSTFSRSLRTKTSTVRSRCVARRPQTRCRSSSRVRTRPLLACERVDEPELGRGQLGARSVDVRLDVVGVEPELLDLDLVAAPRLGLADAATRGRAHARCELLHRERLHEVVVGADLERVDAVVLRAARGDDDDRRADPLVARLLDHAPAVDPGKHEVEDADVGALVAQTREPRLAVRDADGVEPAVSRCRAMPRAMTSSSSMIRTFAIRQHHSVRLRPSAGRTNGDRPVTEWCTPNRRACQANLTRRVCQASLTCA